MREIEEIDEEKWGRQNNYKNEKPNANTNNWRTRNTGQENQKSRQVNQDNRDSAERREVSTLFNNDSNFLLEESEEVEKLEPAQLPVVQAKVESIDTIILIDSGSQLNCISQNFLNKIKAEINVPTLPINNVTIVGALKGKVQKVREQVFLKCLLGEIKFNCVCVVVPALSRNIILGCDWLLHHSVKLCFDGMKLSGKFDNELHEIPFGVESDVGERMEVSAVEDKETNAAMENSRKEEETKAKKIEEAVSAAEEFNENEKQMLRQLLEEFDIFSDKPGVINCYEHNIVLKDYSPFRIKSYPIPVVFQNAVRKQIQEMLDWGVIEKRPTQYVSPLVVVRKNVAALEYVWMQDTSTEEWRRILLFHQIRMNYCVSLILDR